MHFGDNVCILGTHLIFHEDFAQTITNVRKVEVYGSKLVPNR